MTKSYFFKLFIVLKCQLSLRLILQTNIALGLVGGLLDDEVGRPVLRLHQVGLPAPRLNDEMLPKCTSSHTQELSITFFWLNSKV